MATLDRRTFLSLGGSLTLGFSFFGCLPANGTSSQATSTTSPATSPPPASQIDAWLQILADGRIRVLTGKMELGQGLKMALQQVAGEELNIPPDQVEIILADTAIEAGEAINPEGIQNQTEGGLIQAASWTLFEQVALDPEGIRSKDWGSYPIMRFRAVPHTEVSVIDRPDLPPLGAGEAAQGPAAAALANAVYHACGKRVRDLPIEAHL